MDKNNFRVAISKYQDKIDNSIKKMEKPLNEWYLIVDLFKSIDSLKNFYYQYTLEIAIISGITGFLAGLVIGLI